MILSYDTVKYVSIQDSRLGVLRYVLMLLILLYVGCIEMYANGGYLFSDSIHGVLRFTVQQPTIQNCDPFNENSASSCENSFRPREEFTYCKQYSIFKNISNDMNDNDDYHGNVYPCQYYEAINAQIITETSVTIITRGKLLNQSFVCGNDDDEDEDGAWNHSSLANLNTNGSCPHTYQTIVPTSSFPNSTTPTNTTTTTTAITPFYVTQSEAFTILIDHAVTATKLCHMSSSASLSSISSSYTCSSTSSQNRESSDTFIHSGRLYTTNLKLCQQYTSYPTIWSSRNNTLSLTNTTTSCYIEPNVTVNHFDYFSIAVLLQAAGINSLDDCIDEPATGGKYNSSSSKCNTYRESGATIMVHVLWNDFIPYHGMVQPYYYYRVQLINKSYKTYIPFYHSYYRQGGRTLLIAHGVRFVFVLGGEFHTFHLTTFLITLTTALGLFAVATTIIDYLMIYILPEKEKYTKAKYEATDVINRIEIPSSIVPPFIHQSFNNMSTPREPAVLTTMLDSANAASSTRHNDDDEGTLHEPLLSTRGLPDSH